MVGMSYAAVPLYDLFCRVTGFGGTTQIASKRSNTVSDRPIKVRFDAMANNIDWAFQPIQRQIELKVGENALAFYRATNRASESLTGTATFNVTPLKVGAYFSKVECFCFDLCRKKNERTNKQTNERTNKRTNERTVVKTS